MCVTKGRKYLNTADLLTGCIPILPTHRIPYGLENLEKWEGIFQSGNFEQNGKSHKLLEKVGEFQTNVIYYFLVILK